MTYNNSVINVTHTPTPDPFITYAHGKFYLTYTAGDRVEVWCSDSLFNFGNCSRHVIWKPEPGHPWSGGIWAPEIHSLDGRWYCYVAAENPKEGNKSHRMYVIGGPPASQDPCQGPWEFIGPLRGVPQDQWAIDGTVIHLNNQLYFVYSGWPLGEHHSDKTQELFIVHLLNPAEADGSRPPTRISHPDFDWERSGPSGINEGPQWLASPNGSWVGIAYSCAGSWTKDYKTNTIQYTGGDPLDQNNWRKSNTPLICTPDGTNGPWGPGHGSFLPVGHDIVYVFHATDQPTDGWNNRKARCQRVNFTHSGPDMGNCVGPLCEANVFMQGSGSGSGSHDPLHGLEEKLHGFLGKAKEKLREL
ncbi:glycoside hydrolase family 43 protein [Aplosporella prunicola CBS 121167]|uniref:Glycoside hydrolase family 43 protein n=1 Tax=Aplosporella prunicola CBS 121167 TaxID=1176127 RepID=A0A6A6BDS9_9PEZI|nr:glycoside hydrolase family 43 protein [Aplosporella prunicola CBS 121167]KAF2141404.1 glycoside hydrolase family 43 protein [Aplosporella prunicola CBS 121167]